MAETKKKVGAKKGEQNWEFIKVKTKKGEVEGFRYHGKPGTCVDNPLTKTAVGFCDSKGIFETTEVRLVEVFKAHYKLPEEKTLLQKLEGLNIDQLNQVFKEFYPDNEVKKIYKEVFKVENPKVANKELVIAYLEKNLTKDADVMKPLK